MPKASPIQTTFSAGELGPELSGRTDIEEYQAGVTRMENFIPTIQGPAVRRAGTRFVSQAKTGSSDVWLARFEFNTEQAYILEISRQISSCAVRFYSNGEPVIVPAGIISVWAPSTVYTIGSFVSNGGINYYCKVTHTSSALGFALDSSKWWALTGNILEIPGPDVWKISTTEGLFNLRYVQSGDVVYFCDGLYPVFKLSRLGTNTWTFTAVEFANGPFKNIDPTTTTTIYASAATGSGITLTSSAAIFTIDKIDTLLYLERKLTDDTKVWEPGKTPGTGTIWRVGNRYYEALNNKSTGTIIPTHTSGSEFDGHDGVQWKFLNPGYGHVKITAVSFSGTTATATVIKTLPNEVVGSGNATTRWAWSEFIDGRPSHVTFFKERLVLARASDQRIFMSVVGDYENFDDRDDGGVLTQDSAITIDVVSDNVNRIEWIVPADVLLVGTAGGEHAIRELTTNEALGPGNITCIKISEYGSASVQPIRVGNSILFVQRAGRKIRELAFSDQAFNADGYGSIDLTILAPHLLPRGKYITQIAYQQEPHSVVWAVRNDGLLLGVRYNANRKAVGWSRHVIGGNGIVQSVQTIPHPDGDRDQLWLIVQRTINGSVVRYVEYLEIEWTSADAAGDRFYVDSGLTYSGTPVTTLTLLDHLEGQVVDVLADGATHPQRTVTAGTITLARAASKVQVGLPCPAKLQSLRMTAGAGDGTAQGKTKRIHVMAMRFLDTVGGKTGPAENQLDIIPFRDSGDPMNLPPPAFTGDKVDIAWPSGYETEGYVWYVNDQPLPATVVAIMPQLHTQDR